MCGKWDYWKPWVTSKTPIPPLMAQFTELCKGCPYCNIVPVNQYVLYIELFLCLYMHCPIIIIIMYIYVLAEYSIKEEDICYSFNIILRVKRMCFYKANQFQRKKQIKLKLFKNLF